MQSSTPKKVIIVSGPTAVGKTGYAIRLAQEHKAHVFSADSRQIYKEMPIGTGQPSPYELAKVPHHFIGHLSIQSSYSAGQYAQDLHNALNIYFQTHDVAILAGGTGLYIDAFLYGLDHLPSTQEEVRAAVNHDLETKGLEYLLHELWVNDPTTYSEIDRKNPRRVSRPLEIFRQTGVPFSELKQRKQVPSQYQLEHIALTLPISQLLDRIEARVTSMLDNGWAEEAKSLIPFRKLQALQTVGYKELFDFIDGMHSVEETKKLILKSTKAYAKRQMTWIRNSSNAALLTTW